MGPERSEQAAIPVKRRGSKNRIMFFVVVLILTYFAGFLPGYLKGQRQERELRVARQENSLAQLRDLAGLAYLQASQRDYGMAAGTSTRLFDSIRQVSSQAPDSPRSKSLEELLTLRDPITGSWQRETRKS